ncbi:MAG: hypothetical protein K6E16_03475 [Lachnospiraceae bacterium]|nr:hypothetical protein [Lachnospiraceae bacterium]
MADQKNLLNEDELAKVSGGSAENDGSEDSIIHIQPPKEREKTVCGDCGYVAYGDLPKQPCPKCGSHNFG